MLTLLLSSLIFSVLYRKITAGIILAGLRFVLALHTVHSFCMKSFDALVKKKTKKKPDT